MKLQNENAEIIIQNKKEGARKSLIIAAHQDDAEIMAYHPIMKSYHNEKESVYVVILSDGAGSPRTGEYANYTDEQMKEIRYVEQKTAAKIGEYSGLYLLKYPSSQIKSLDPRLLADLQAIVEEIQPNEIYMHHMFDKHPTHVGSSLSALAALTKIKIKSYLEHVYGCEVWRGLDWVVDQDKISFDTSRYIEELARPLLTAFDSQVSGGKRYDEATIGRWKANATFGASHQVDSFTSCSYAISLDAIVFQGVSFGNFIEKYIASFQENITSINPYLK